jgi:hypothetical protein
MIGLLVAVALSLTPMAQAAHAKPVGVSAQQMMIADSADMAMPGSDHMDNCAGKSKKMQRDCLAVCCGLVALPVAIALIGPPAGAAPWPGIECIGVGRDDPPDPYPPRPTFLG